MAVLGDAYPAIRTDRNVGTSGTSVTTTTSGAAAPTAPLPRIRLWPFHMTEVGGVNIIVSAPFTGPAVIDAIWLGQFSGNASPFHTCSLFVSRDDGGAGFNQPNGTMPSGQRIFDPSTFSSDLGESSVDLEGWNVLGSTAGNPWTRFPLRYPVQLDAFFLKVRIYGGAAPGSRVVGVVRVVEGIPPDQLPNFL